MKIIVGTGWWAPDDLSQTTLTRHERIFPMWHHFVRKYIDPDGIVVINSANERKPDFNAYDDVEVINLDKNYGTGNAIRNGAIKTKYNGWTRSCYLSCAYALACDADWFVYVEQDCLLRGPNLLQEATHSSIHPVWLGPVPGKGYKPGTTELVQLAGFHQVSLIIARNDGLISLMKACVEGPYTDGEKPAEVRLSENLGGKFNLIKIPFGRSRPLDLSAPVMYAQDWTREELKMFLEQEAPQFLSSL